MPRYYVDVHCHLTDPRYQDDLEQVLANCRQAGLARIVINGLNPATNRQILQLQQQHPDLVRAALGIYPLYVRPDRLRVDLPHIETFDLDAEIQFIREQAEQGHLAAVGECGLDGHYLSAEELPDQERVLLELGHIAKAHDLPLIVHSRKFERRAFEVLQELEHDKIIMHCYSGKSKWALQALEKQKFSFSIPANAPKHQGFQKLLRSLPLECILTETDSPYLSPIPGTRNSPENVVGVVKLLAEYRELSIESAKQQIWQNYQSLFAEDSQV